MVYSSMYGCMCMLTSCLGGNIGTDTVFTEML